MSKVLKKLYIWLIILFLYAPIVVLMVYSFNDSRSRATWSGFTFRWYIELFQDRMILQALYYTITIALLSSVIATIIGKFAAIGIFGYKKLSFNLVRNISYIPVINADIVTGVSLMLLFVFLGINQGFFTLLIAHITFNIPYVIFSVLPKLYQMDVHVYEAAMDLGASPLTSILKVVIPEIRHGIITGFLLAFTLSLDDFVISFFTTGPGVNNLSIIIYSMARRGINPKINALSTLMFAVVMILLFVINKKSASNNHLEKKVRREI
jgi:spermidine/putrescine transport system permease protein